MNLVSSIAMSVVLMAGAETSAEDWDRLDVVDGRNPTLRYGSGMTRIDE